MNDSDRLLLTICNNFLSTSMSVDCIELGRGMKVNPLLIHNETLTLCSLSTTKTRTSWSIEQNRMDFVFL